MCVRERGSGTHLCVGGILKSIEDFLEGNGSPSLLINSSPDDTISLGSEGKGGV